MVGPNQSLRGDSVLTPTRRVAVGVFAILVPAVIVLWGAPGHTRELWAWTIKPDLTPIFLGSGYGAGAFFFWRTFRASRWNPSSAGVFSAAAFAGAMLIATLLHFDKFNHGHAPPLAVVAFFGWTIVYIISPPVVFVIWLRNQRADRGEPGLASEPMLSPSVVGAARTLGAAMVVAAAVLFVFPHITISVWPWKLTPLTARVLASFMLQVGVGITLLSRDARWSSWRLLIQTFFVATAFLLVGAIRAFGDFDTGNVMTWLYLGGLIGADLGLVVLYRTYEHAGAVAVPGRA